MNKITRIKPNEAQGIAKSPSFSSDHIASGFRWGTAHLDMKGVYEAPGPNKCDVDAGGGKFGTGFQKP